MSLSRVLRHFARRRHVRQQLVDQRGPHEPAVPASDPAPERQKLCLISDKTSKTLLRMRARKLRLVHRPVPAVI